MVNGCEFLDKYILVGGSALTLHSCHRKSEDLDLLLDGVKVTFFNAKWDFIKPT